MEADNAEREAEQKKSAEVQRELAERTWVMNIGQFLTTELGKKYYAWHNKNISITTRGSWRLMVQSMLEISPIATEQMVFTCGERYFGSLSQSNQIFEIAKASRILLIICMRGCCCDDPTCTRQFNYRTAAHQYSGVHLDHPEKSISETKVQALFKSKWYGSKKRLKKGDEVRSLAPLSSDCHDLGVHAIGRLREPMNTRHKKRKKSTSDSD
jgi:hypothetical protein